MAESETPKEVPPPAAKKKKQSEIKGPKVVMVHGLAVPRAVMFPLGLRLQRQYKRQTYNFPYNSWGGDIPELARQLSQKLQELKLEEFDAVTHSMGAIVLRWAMNNQPMPRLRRAVLVSPPNGGSALAEKLYRRLGILYRLGWGPCAIQLRPGDFGLATNAGPLGNAEVGVIAGGSGTPKGIRNVFGLEGDNDRIVTVEETILPGMKDFVLLRQDHTSILFSAQTAHMINLFLEHGIFRPKLADLSKATATP